MDFPCNKPDIHIFSFCLRKDPLDSPHYLFFAEKKVKMKFY